MRRKNSSNRDLVQEEYRDSDGYWIYLKRGWQNGADPGTHGIVESTKREAYRTLTMAKPCKCADCRMAYCFKCGCELTGTDRAAKRCTQCGHGLKPAAIARPLEG